jgi:hypothetical protein
MLLDEVFRVAFSASFFARDYSYSGSNMYILIKLRFEIFFVWTEGVDDVKSIL